MLSLEGIEGESYKMQRILQKKLEKRFGIIELPVILLGSQSSTTDG